MRLNWCHWVTSASTANITGYRVVRFPAEPAWHKVHVQNPPIMTDLLQDLQVVATTSPGTSSHQLRKSACPFLISRMCTADIAGKFNSAQWRMRSLQSKLDDLEERGSHVAKSLDLLWASDIYGEPGFHRWACSLDREELNTCPYPKRLASIFTLQWWGKDYHSVNARLEIHQLRKFLTWQDWGMGRSREKASLFQAKRCWGRSQIKLGKWRRLPQVLELLCKISLWEISKRKSQGWALIKIHLLEGKLLLGMSCPGSDLQIIQVKRKLESRCLEINHPTKRCCRQL